MSFVWALSGRRCPECGPPPPKKNAYLRRAFWTLSERADDRGRVAGGGGVSVHRGGRRVHGVSYNAVRSSVGLVEDTVQRGAGVGDVLGSLAHVVRGVSSVEQEGDRELDGGYVETYTRQHDGPVRPELIPLQGGSFADLVDHSRDVLPTSIVGGGALPQEEIKAKVCGGGPGTGVVEGCFRDHE